ncbi:hypothetical protein MY4038_003034 [Beauveria bassiana]
MTYVTGAKNGSAVMPSALWSESATIASILPSEMPSCYVYAHAIERYSVEIKYINGGRVAVVRIFGFLYCVTTTGASADDIAS